MRAKVIGQSGSTSVEVYSSRYIDNARVCFDSSGAAICVQIPVRHISGKRWRQVWSAGKSRSPYVESLISSAITKREAAAPKGAAVSRGQSASKSLDEIVADALMTGYGYRKTTELRGEYIVGADHRVESNTLHTAEVWVRDRSGQPPNPANHDEALS